MVVLDCTAKVIQRAAYGYKPKIDDDICTKAFMIHVHMDFVWC